MNFGELICKNADSFIPLKERNDFYSKKELGRFILIARQLAEAFYVNINLCILCNDSDNPNNTCENILLKTTETKFISNLFIFITRDLTFAGKLIIQNHWDSEKIYYPLTEIQNKILACNQQHSYHNRFAES